MSKSFFYILLIFTFLPFIFSTKPIIGFYALVEPITDYQNYTKEAVDGNLVRWIESSGAEIVIIHIWYTEEEISTLLSKINGVFFQAGPRRPLKYDEPWEKKARYIFEYAKDNSIPIWGTCLGMQMLTVFMSKDGKLLEKYEDLGLKIVELTDKAKDSSIYGLFKEKDFENIQNIKSNFYVHRHGIFPEKFFNNKNLVDNFDVIGFGYDNNNKKLVNVIESKKNQKHKIFGTQYHPEMNPYERRKSFNEENHMDGLRRSQLIAMKFVEETRKNNNKFNSYDEKSKYTFVSTYQTKKGQAYDQKTNKFYYSIN